MRDVLARPSLRRELGVFASMAFTTQAEAVLSVVGAVLLVRLAGAEEAGRVFFAQAVAGVWALVCDPRTDDVALRYVPVYQAERRGYGAWLLDRLLRIDLAVTAAGIAGGGALAVLARGAGWTDPHQAALIVAAIVAGGVRSPAGLAGVGLSLTGDLHRLARLRLAAAGFGAVVSVAALLLAGPLAYLAAGAAAAALSGTVLLAATRRRLAAAFGPPVPRPGPAPKGMLRFAVHSSTASTVVAASDQGVLALAGVIGGPLLVTTLKVAAAPGRLLLNMAGPIGPQLYPRMAAAVIARDLREVRRDLLRASALLAAGAGVVLAAAAPVAGRLLGLIYGPGFAGLAPVALVLLAAAGVRACVVWSKTLALVLGRPGLRLASVTLDGLLLLGALALFADAAGYAWGALGVALLAAALWLIALPRLTESA
jgi:O-antigen/teichoic acid export membrane protein